MRHHDILVSCFDTARVSLANIFAVLFFENQPVLTYLMTLSKELFRSISNLMIFFI